VPFFLFWFDFIYNGQMKCDQNDKGKNWLKRERDFSTRAIALGQNDKEKKWFSK
jgi:hypothetical protein